MRKTVDEKLESTLNARLKNSFEIVNQQLESVNTRLGEMRSVAESVSNLNKTLSGSKTRGILGELQLSQIIEDMLPSHLYEREAQVRENSTERVEFAIKLPGQEEDGFAYLPIDSKFPLDDYYRLLEGYEKGDVAIVDATRKILLSRIKEFAKEIRRKYINPPRTTNFAILFLPTEGLYAEAVRDAVFFEDLRKMDVMIAGPTTLSALLSSLLVGFKTLQIQKGAVEIQRTLEKAKKEFGNFNDVLQSAQKRIEQTGKDLDLLVGTRTRKINAALRGVQVIGSQEDEDGFPELETFDEETDPGSPEDGE
jgi:DNA recombination protein RmuC